MRKVLFTPIAFEQYNEWQKQDKTVFAKIQKLIKETCKTPFEGTGKPEPLKHSYSGCWSRKITDEHRLVYIVRDECIEFIACKFHYTA